MKLMARHIATCGGCDDIREDCPHMITCFRGPHVTRQVDAVRVPVPDGPPRHASSACDSLEREASPAFLSKNGNGSVKNPLIVAQGSRLAVGLTRDRHRHRLRGADSDMPDSLAGRRVSVEFFLRRADSHIAVIGFDVNAVDAAFWRQGPPVR